MSILDLHADAAIEAAVSSPKVAPEPAAPKFSAWSAIPRGVAVAAGEVGGTLADIAGSFAYMRDATPEQRKQIDRGGVPIEAMTSDLGEQTREYWKEFKPDPQTASAAEQVLFGFARGASKVVAGALVAGPAGVLAAGVQEGLTVSDELRMQGVNVQTRGQAGLVQGTGLALAALPLVGTTLAQTAGLYLAGGPGGFMAQQALTREILQNGGYDKLGEQYDPFDPVGLAVSALIPAVFTAWGVRGQRIEARAKAAEDFRTGPVPSDVAPVADAVRQAYAPETVGAARVLFGVESRAASNPGADTMRTADAHEAALTRAEEQIAAGERVSVADVAPRYMTPAERDANLAAFMDGSKVVDAEGKPLVLYHGTADAFDSFSLERAGTNGQNFGRMIFMSTDPTVASGYAVDLRKNPEYMAVVERETVARNAWAKSAAVDGVDSAKYAAVKAEHDAISSERRALASRLNTFSEPTEGANVVPVYAALRNPLEVDGGGRFFFQVHEQAISQAREGGHDGVIIRNVIDSATTETRKAADVVVAFNPAQVKSATGNSGRFDPSSPSLTDPLTDFAAGVRGLMDARSEPASPRSAPDAAAPVQADSGSAAPAPVAAAPPKPAAGATPGAAAESQAATARIAEVQAQHPDLMVMLDGMDKPMAMADFLASVKAEADEMTADAPLYEVAAQCALLNGP